MRLRRSRGMWAGISSLSHSTRLVQVLSEFHASPHSATPVTPTTTVHPSTTVALSSARLLGQRLESSTASLFPRIPGSLSRSTYPPHGLTQIWIGSESTEPGRD